jgi:hypothetical protein
VFEEADWLEKSESQSHIEKKSREKKTEKQYISTEFAPFFFFFFYYYFLFSLFLSSHALPQKTVSEKKKKKNPNL